MAFTPAELNSLANAALDFHERKQPLAQSIQERPMLAKLVAKKRMFPGGKGDITSPVKGKFAFEGTPAGAPARVPGDLRGYTHNDTVDYGNIAGIERVRYPWREMHTGWSVTNTELKIDGISVVDTARGERTSNHSKREMTAITNILEDKVETFQEIQERQLNNMFWGDGTVDPLGMLGVQYFMTNTPAVGVTGGIDRATNPWWRNRYQTWPAATTDLPAVLHSEMRQLRRYGGRIDVACCGSTFLDALIDDLRADNRGMYTQAGWNKPQSTDIAIADVHQGSLEYYYDPSLDDLGLDSEAFLMDSRRMFIYAMDSEWAKDHNPSRPYDTYAIYKARTYTGNMIATQLNCHGRYSVT